MLQQENVKPDPNVRDKITWGRGKILKRNQKKQVSPNVSEQEGEERVAICHFRGKKRKHYLWLNTLKCLFDMQAFYQIKASRF